VGEAVRESLDVSGVGDRAIVQGRLDVERRGLLPGDTLRMHCTITKSRGPIGFGEAKAYVGEELACSGELMFAIK